MAHPFDDDGAMKSAERPFGRIAMPFLTPSTSVSRLTRSQSSASAGSLSCGIRQWLATSISSASGKRARTSRPRG